MARGVGSTRTHSSSHFVPPGWENQPPNGTSGEARGRLRTSNPHGKEMGIQPVDLSEAAKLPALQLLQEPPPWW
jgi:hypothetical protein